MDVQKEISLRNAISYCIENNDVNTATNKIIEFIRDEKEAINFIRCSTQLRRESKSFTDLKTIADIQRLYPNQESYGVSVSDGLQKFYVNNEVIYTKALIV